MINIGICDDDLDEQNHLEKLLLKYSKQHNIEFNIKSFNNGYLFLDSIKNKKTFDICFLDIYMPALSGIDTAKELRLLDKTTQLIFTTSSKKFALDGYAVQATNYLLKPLEEESFFVALSQVLQKISIENTENIQIPTKMGYQLLSPNIITYIEVLNNNSIIHINGDKTIISSVNLTKMQEILEENLSFMLVSRSILINFDNVIGLENEKFVMSDGTKIIIPRRKKKELTKAFLDYRMQD